METNIEHHSYNGTIFRSKSPDLQRGVEVVLPSWELSNEEFISDSAEFGAWFALHIHPTLNHFPGMTSIRYVVLQRK